jgi:hypothetical protein
MISYIYQNKLDIRIRELLRKKVFVRFKFVSIFFKFSIIQLSKGLNYLIFHFKIWITIVKFQILI